MLLATPVNAAEFVVNDPGLLGDLNEGDGVCETGNGTCTLIAAIAETRASAGPHTITIAVPGPIGFPGGILPDDLTLRSSEDVDVILRGGDLRVGERSSIGDTSPSSGFRIEGNIFIWGEDSAVRNNIIVRNDDPVEQGFGIVEVMDGSPSNAEQRRADRAILENNVFFNTGKNISVIQVKTNDAVIQGNVIGFDEDGNVAPGDSGIAYGILALSSQRLTISENLIYGYGVGLVVSELENSMIDNNLIGNVKGIADAGATGSGPVLGNGIVSANGFGNNFRGNISNGHALNGIALLSSTDAVLVDNEFSDNGNAGIVTDAESTGYRFELNRLVNNGGLAIDVLNDGIINNAVDDGLPNPPSIVVTGENGIQRFEGTFSDPEFVDDFATVCFSASTSCPGAVSGESDSEFPLFCQDAVLDTASGEFLISAAIAPDEIVPAGRFITATVTTSAGTSELSECAEVPELVVVEPLEFYPVNAWVLNPRSAKSLLGVFLGSEVNDVTTVEIDSLRLGEASGSVVSMPDFNEDGYTDLMVRFRGRDTGAECGDTVLVLTGEHAFGAFERELDLRTVGCSGKGKGKD
ncbi:NosD domain-containing protein [Wenzhouxiangella limi]|uniref:Right-handed parallel beta-helix repeat-containing protein n=1 Tax=Wenzhouxiangella limi TaxID=2707351 RepID=A0A845VIJ1_9GAMM|nr:NosD domain-containing protein [Wenzhouxiangella limi]NDY96989.1 right-handed parallel beta-helix repeat-containing protein [Wenzhouxiangella limi]